MLKNNDNKIIKELAELYYLSENKNMPLQINTYTKRELETHTLSDNHSLNCDITNHNLNNQLSQGTTITREVLSRKIQHKFNHLSFNQARSLVDDVFSIISDEIVAQREVALKGFGSFKIREKRERPGRDPRTGVYAPICARKVVLFKPSKLMRRIISSQNSKIKISSSQKYKKTAEISPGR
jgi:integration host factor subunit alpha